MKLLHTSDWHIGKKLNGYSLMDEQWHVFRRIKEIAGEENVDGIIIAGDLYDRAIPPTEAIEAFDKMLRELNMEMELPIYAISGNHDGANRLNFANSWLAKSKLHLVTKLSEAFTPIEEEDVQIFMIPFFDPIDAREYYEVPEEEIGSMGTIGQAMERIITDLYEKFDADKKHILVSHFFVTGKKNKDYEMTSETTSIVGGLNSIDAGLFSGFDYVALGHLHWDKASPDEFVRYSGSPMKFNTREADNEKGVYIVNILKEGITHEFHPIQPQKDIIILEDTFEKLSDASFYKGLPAPGEAYYSIKLTKRPLGVENLRGKLAEIYGDVVDFEVLEGYGKNPVQRFSETRGKELSEEALVSLFYEEVKGKKLSGRQLDLLASVLQTLRRKEEDQ